MFELDFKSIGWRIRRWESPLSWSCATLHARLWDQKVKNTEAMGSLLLESCSGPPSCWPTQSCYFWSEEKAGISEEPCHYIGYGYWLDTTAIAYLESSCSGHGNEFNTIFKFIFCTPSFCCMEKNKHHLRFDQDVMMTEWNSEQQMASRGSPWPHLFFY